METCYVCGGRARFEALTPPEEELSYTCKLHMFVWLEKLDKGDVVQIVGLKEL